MNFMKDKFDRLIYQKDRDYGIVFMHLDIGDTTIAKSNTITQTTAKNSHHDGEYESLIDNIDNTQQCGICGSRDDPIYCNKGKKSKKIDWIVCDGPREDDSDSILCNQWYHEDCIKCKYKNNQFYNSLSIIVGIVIGLKI